MSIIALASGIGLVFVLTRELKRQLELIEKGK